MKRSAELPFSRVCANSQGNRDVLVQCLRMNAGRASEDDAGARREREMKPFALGTRRRGRRCLTS
jgi:hypothetical protein